MDFWRLSDDDFETIARRICRRNGWRYLSSSAPTTGLWRAFTYDDDGETGFYTVGEAAAAYYLRAVTL